MNYTIKSTENDIQHHGILGQKWGKRQGPPYPLDGSDHSAAEKKAGWKKSLDKQQENSNQLKSRIKNHVIGQDYDQKYVKKFDKKVAKIQKKYDAGKMSNHSYEKKINREIAKGKYQESKIDDKILSDKEFRSDIKKINTLNYEISELNNKLARFDHAINSQRNRDKVQKLEGELREKYNTYTKSLESFGNKIVDMQVGPERTNIKDLNKIEEGKAYFTWAVNAADSHAARNTVKIYATQAAIAAALM